MILKTLTPIFLVSIFFSNLLLAGGSVGGGTGITSDLIDLASELDFRANEDLNSISVTPDLVDQLLNDQLVLDQAQEILSPIEKLSDYQSLNRQITDDSMIVKSKFKNSLGQDVLVVEKNGAIHVLVQEED